MTRLKNSTTATAAQEVHTAACDFMNPGDNFLFSVRAGVSVVSALETAEALSSAAHMLIDKYVREEESLDNIELGGLSFLLQASSALVCSSRRALKNGGAV